MLQEQRGSNQSRDVAEPLPMASNSSQGSKADDQDNQLR